MAKEMGFVSDTLEKVCRLADVLKFMEFQFECEIVNNVIKGKATVIVKPESGSDFKGGRTATFSVASQSLKNYVLPLVTSI